MTTTGTYSINGTDLLIQPSEGKWVTRAVLGLDGAGHPIYSALREFEMDWDLFDTATWNQIQGFYNVVGNTGTCVVNLPQYGAPNFSFLTYSGCTMGESEMGGDFITQDGWLMKMKLVIMAIKTP